MRDKTTKFTVITSNGVGKAPTVHSVNTRDRRENLDRDWPLACPKCKAEVPSLLCEEILDWDANEPERLWAKFNCLCCGRTFQAGFTVDRLQWC